MWCIENLIGSKAILDTFFLHCIAKKHSNWHPFLVIQSKCTPSDYLINMLRTVKEKGRSSNIPIQKIQKPLRSVQTPTQNMYYIEKKGVYIVLIKFLNIFTNQVLFTYTCNNHENLPKVSFNYAQSFIIGYYLHLL